MVDLVGRFSNPRAREWRVGASSVEDDVIPNRSDRGARWRPQHRLTEDQIDQIADAYLDGDTVVAIADQFGVHRSTVLGHVAGRDRGTRTRAATLRETEKVVT